jgi:malate/lactate dehydrogenase
VACLDVLRTLVKEGRNVLSVTIRWEHILEGTQAAMSAPVVVGQLGGEHIELPGLDEKARSAFAERARTYAGWLEEGAWR